MAAQTYQQARESAANTSPLTIGVLALQGDYEAHARAFAGNVVRAVLVRKPDELASLDGLVLPGGESTTMLKFLESRFPDNDGSNNGGFPGAFFGALVKFASAKPVFATCAGCILLAREVLHPTQRSLGVLDVTVERNAYGRQIDSAILTLPTELPGGPLEMVFIRSPRITRVGDQVEVLAQRDGYPTLVRQGHLLAATFHPEMSADTRVQQLFLEIVRAHKHGVRK
jgi:5'-phosphate synthase pdxT subunit